VTCQCGVTVWHGTAWRGVTWRHSVLWQCAVTVWRAMTVWRGVTEWCGVVAWRNGVTWCDRAAWRNELRDVAWRGVTWRKAAPRRRAGEAGGVGRGGAARDLVLHVPSDVFQHLGHWLGQLTRAPVRCFQRDAPLRFWVSRALAEQLHAVGADAKPGPAPTVVRQSPSGVHLSATEEPAGM
jgi:hypothetical protein